MALKLYFTENLNTSDNENQRVTTVSDMRMKIKHAIE